MKNRCVFVCVTIMVAALLFAADTARAQSAPASASKESPFTIDAGIGLDFGLNGNVNSGAIGRLQGLSTAILPQSYGEVYGTGINLRFGGGYALNELSELRGVFTFQSADANLVRLGDIGPSSLYAQYSDYKSFGLEQGYWRYVPLTVKDLRVYGEAMIGAAFVDSISSEFAAPQANAVFESTDFYDQSAAFTWSLNVGALFKVAEHMDINGQLGFRHVGGLAEIDQLVGTGLDTINDDSARLTFPIVVGVRFRF